MMSIQTALRAVTALLLTACALGRGSRVAGGAGGAGGAAPMGCRATGLWVLERHDRDAVRGYWLTLAMAPWANWTMGFLVADGQGASLRVRVSDADQDHIVLISAQDGLDREPTVFARSQGVLCDFYAAGPSETYRFRRER